MKNRNPHTTHNAGKKSNDSFIAAEWNYPIELASTKLWESDISTRKHQETQQNNARNQAFSPYPGPCLVRLKTLRCQEKNSDTGKFSEVQEVDRQSRKFMAPTLHSQSTNGFTRTIRCTIGTLSVLCWTKNLTRDATTNTFSTAGKRHAGPCYAALLKSEAIHSLCADLRRDSTR